MHKVSFRSLPTDSEDAALVHWQHANKFAMCTRNLKLAMHKLQHNKVVSAAATSDSHADRLLTTFLYVCWVANASTGSNCSTQAGTYSTTG